MEKIGILVQQNECDKILIIMSSSVTYIPLIEGIKPDKMVIEVQITVS